MLIQIGLLGGTSHLYNLWLCSISTSLDQHYYTDLGLQRHGPSALCRVLIGFRAPAVSVLYAISVSLCMSEHTARHRSVHVARSRACATKRLCSRDVFSRSDLGASTKFNRELAQIPEGGCLVHCAIIKVVQDSRRL